MNLLYNEPSAVANHTKNPVLFNQLYNIIFNGYNKLMYYECNESLLIESPIFVYLPKKKKKVYKLLEKTNHYY